MDIPCRFFVKIYETNYSPRIKKINCVGKKRKNESRTWEVTASPAKNIRDLEKEDWLKQSERYTIWLQLLQCVDIHNKHKDF